MEKFQFFGAYSLRLASGCGFAKTFCTSTLEEGHLFQGVRLTVCGIFEIYNPEKRERHFVILRTK